MKKYVLGKAGSRKGNISKNRTQEDLLKSNPLLFRNLPNIVQLLQGLVKAQHPLLYIFTSSFYLTYVPG